MNCWGVRECRSSARLDATIDIVDRLQKRKMRAPGQPRQPGLLTVGDLLGSEQHQKIPLRPALTLGAVDQNAPHAPRIRQLQPFEQRIDPRRRDHDRRPTRREDTPPVLGRVRARRCAPALRAPSAAWTPACTPQSLCG